MSLDKPHINESSSLSFILFQSWTLQFLLAHSNFFFLYRYSYHSRHLWILVRLPSPYLMKISKWLDQHIFINNLSLTYIFYNLFVFKCFLFLILAPFLFFKSWSPTQVKVYWSRVNNSFFISSLRKLNMIYL